MERQRVHRAVSDDGTEIVGGVYGGGPPVVLVHGSMADGDMDWAEMLPLLTDEFTCYVPSTRGRGQSGSHPDLSREARVCDVAAFASSIGEPVALVGFSAGGMLALGAAVRTPRTTAVAVYEPIVLEARDDDDSMRFREAVARMTRAFQDGNPTAAAEVFIGQIANDEELEILSADPESLDAVGRYLAVDIEEFREAIEFEGWSPTDPSVLSEVAVPVLLLKGTRTAMHGWFTRGVHYVARHVQRPAVREIEGAGHLGPLVQPQAVANELVDFLAKVHGTGPSTRA